MRTKPLVRRLHLVVGLAAAAPLMLLGGTGALLVFPQEVRRLTAAEDLSVVPRGSHLSPTAMVEAARAALPAGDPVVRLVYPIRADGPLLAEGKDHLAVLDPYDGRALRVSTWGGDFVTVVTRLHVDLFAGEAGTWVTGLASVALMGLCVSGLWLWRPAGRWDRRYFTVKLRNGRKRANYDLHRAAGFYASALLLVVAGTGATMAFWGAAEPVVNVVTWSDSSPPRPTDVAPRPGDPLTPDEVVAIAMRQAPGTELRRLYVPTAPSKPYRVFLDPPGEHEMRTNEARFAIDPFTGTILHATGPSTTTRSDRVLAWVLPLHFGTFGGTATKAVYVFVSLSPIVLGVTGTAIWWGRRGRRRASRERAEERVAAAVSV